MRKIEWKPILGYEGFYEVSNTGIIKSIKRVVDHKHSKSISIKNRSMKLCEVGSGKKKYLGTQLSKNGIGKQKLAHRIVAEAFIDNPDKKLCINHKDGNKHNNNVENLEWCTHLENRIHAKENNLINVPLGEDSASAKLTEAEVLIIRDTYLMGVVNQYELAEQYGITQSQVSRILKRKAWRHV